MELLENAVVASANALEERPKTLRADTCPRFNRGDLNEGEMIADRKDGPAKFSELVCPIVEKHVTQVAARRNSAQRAGGYASPSGCLGLLLIIGGDEVGSQQGCFGWGGAVSHVIFSNGGPGRQIDDIAAKITHCQYCI